MALTRLGIVDLHSHFPMHIDASTSGAALRAMTRRRRKSFGEYVRAVVLDIASRLFNYRTVESGPSVTLHKLRAGHVGVALSVLYQAFDELDVEHTFDADPRQAYFEDLLADLERVERYVHAKQVPYVAVAHNPSELQKALDEGKTALVHAVEGGFHFGGTAAEVTANVAEIARRGVAYITVAHLFYRGVATNAPALPFLPDWVYRLLFPQPNLGLTPLGGALVDAMVEHKILVDVTHMSERSTLDALARIPADVPVFATHIACRFGSYAYNLTDDIIKGIAAHGGVMGVILCDHFANEGRGQTKTFAESFDAIKRQIDHIYDLTGTHDHTAIGTDLDGFIKPTLHGLGDASNLVRLEEALVEHYGPSVAEQICNGNALKVLLGYWRGRSV
jgi:microsomal dipeptidase-like Zn-dependent dipeptidase